jgi:small subunit ribosomal protein S1
VIKFSEIKIAQHSGFCTGVRRALDLAEKAVQREKGPVYTWGPLVHNPRVIADLKKKGIEPLSGLKGVPPGILVIRAHGAPPEVYAEARQRGFTILDGTCPSVQKCQKIAAALAQEGKDIVIVGKRGHPEVIGICGWSGDKAVVVENPTEGQELHFTNPVGVLAQTTQNENNFRKVVAVLKDKAPELEVYPTICGATRLRQEAALELAKEVDVMVVIGAHTSSNTMELVKLCRQTGVPVYHIETAAELCREWLQNKDRIGVIAGASTPDVTIEEVIRVMTDYQRPEGQNIEDMYASTLRTLQEGEIISGKVVRIDNDEVLVDIGYKSEGIIPLQELTDKPTSSPEDVVAVGDEINVYVMKVENSEGNPLLSKRKAEHEQAWIELAKAYETGIPIEGEVLQVVKGGLIIFVGLRAFLPASQVGLRYEPNLEKYVGQTLRVRVIELDRTRNKVIVSQKVVLEEELAEKRAALWEELAENQVRKGIVTKLTDFGVFVDLGGIEGLVHISELSWARVKHPSEVVQEGDEIEVMVLGVDRERERVSLGLKQVLPDPWEGVADKYPVGTVQEGIVTHIVSFGAFVQLEPGVEGLVHISQLANHRVAEASEVVQVGEKVKVKILDVNEKDRRISLSIKDVAEEKAEEEYTNYQGEEDTASGMKIGEVLGEILEEKEAEIAEDDEE